MSGSTIPAWQRSVARTIVLPAASIPSTASLRWPTKSPDDDADYSIDIDSYLSDSADSIESIVASIAPYNGQASNLTITRADYSDSIITLWLHGGDAPRDHAINLTVATSSGRTLTLTIWLLVQRVSASYQNGRLPIVVGNQGERGLGFLVGQGNPTSLIGRVQESYLDTLTGRIWKRSQIGWEDTGRKVANTAASGPIAISSSITVGPEHDRAVVISTSSAPLSIVLDGDQIAGLQVDIVQSGAGAFTIVPADGVLIAPTGVIRNSTNPGDRVSLTSLGDKRWSVLWLVGGSVGQNVATPEDVRQAQTIAEDARDTANAAKEVAEDTSTAIGEANNMSVAARDAATAATSVATQAKNTASAAAASANASALFAAAAAATAQEQAAAVVQQVKDTVDDLKAKVAGLLYVAPEITSITISPSIAEKGATVSQVTLTVVRSRPDLQVQITGASVAILAAGSSVITLNGSFTSDASWNLTTLDPSNGATASVSVTLPFRQKRYWGVSQKQSLLAADILAMAGQEFATGYAGRSATYDCSAGAYPYYAYPSSWGTPLNVTVGGLPFNAFTVSEISFVNSSGFAEPFKVIRFNTLQNGAAIQVVWQ